jgi:hypothetical protein
MNQKAIVVYLDNSDIMQEEFSWLWKTWQLYSLEDEFDLVVYYNPDAKHRLIHFPGIVTIPMPYIRMASEYKFLNSHYFCLDEWSEPLKRYKYILKTDCDVFLTENIKGFVPTKFMVGEGGFYRQQENNKVEYIKKIAKELGYEYHHMSLIGASFFGKTSEVIPVVKMQALLTERIISEFIKRDDFKDSGFHSGIASMIAGEIIINHVFSQQHLNLYSLDSKCWSTTKIGTDNIHIHAWHSDIDWSKHKYFEGGYKNWQVNLEDAFKNATNYCHWVSSLSYDELKKYKNLYKEKDLSIDYELIDNPLVDAQSYKLIENISRVIDGPEITVVLNGWKRNQHFEKQLIAINSQTVKPKSIMLWQNGDDIKFPDSSNRMTKSICNENLGVWARFAYALNARTEWICIFDDDTIPGNKWFENCLNTMNTHMGLLGTVGIRIHGDYGMYPLKRYGWADINNRKPIEVDYVGHSWFFKREWLSYFWRELPKSQHDMLVGEDMHFSIMLRKWANINTFVPPHPPEDKSLWGSLPDYAWDLGTESVGLSMNPENRKKMSEYAEYMKTKGFIPTRKKSGFVEDENPFKY